MTTHRRAITLVARIALVAPLLLGATSTVLAQSGADASGPAGTRTPLLGTPHFSALSVVESGAAACDLAMTSRVSAAWSRAQVTMVSAPLLRQSSASTRAPVLALDASSPEHRGWRLRAAGTVGAASARCATQSDWTRGWVQITRRISNGGVALSLGARSLAALDPSRDREGLTASLWQQRGRSWFGIDVRAAQQRSSQMSWFTRQIQRPDSSRDSLNGGWNRFNRTLVVPDSGLTTLRAQSVDVRTRWQRQVGRAAFDFTLGGTGALGAGVNGRSARDSSASSLRNGSRVQLWARADTRIALTRSSAVVIGFAALPAQPLLGARAGRVFSMAFALTSGGREAPDSSGDTRTAGSERREFEVQRLISDSTAYDADTSTDTTNSTVTVRLRVRSRGAQQVEVSGEPFEWKPVSLARTQGDWWESIVTLKAGTYRMSVRIDGKQWIAPPGLPPLRDEFGGEVALVTVR